MRMSNRRISSAVSAVALVATSLLSLPGTAKAAGGGGGDAPPPTATPKPYFDDAQNRKQSGPAVGWDLLSHLGWSYAEDSFMVYYRQYLSANAEVGPDGHLIGGSGSLANVWMGSGILPANSKEIDTIARMRQAFTSGSVSYEYVMTYSMRYVKADGTVGTTSGDVSGGIKSYYYTAQ